MPPSTPSHTLNQDKVYKQNETECISSKFQTQRRGKRSGNLLMEWKLQLVPYFVSPGKEINNCRGWICYATVTTIPKKAFFFLQLSKMSISAVKLMHAPWYIYINWEAILSSGFRDLECSENRFLSSALGHLNVSFQIWWWLGLWSFKRFKLHQDEKGKEVHGEWKKKENDIHSPPLSTFYISACR